MTVYDALRKIVDNSNQPSLNWAINYAKAGLAMPEGEALRVQVLYVLNNITHWRGEGAKEVRTTLKAYAKVK